MPKVYRGYSIFVICIATSYKEAANKFNVSEYYARAYAGVVPAKEYFEEVLAYIDSGPIIFEEGKTDLRCKEIPYTELKQIIDEYRENNSILR